MFKDVESQECEQIAAESLLLDSDVSSIAERPSYESFQVIDSFVEEYEDESVLEDIVGLKADVTLFFFVLSFCLISHHLS